MAEGVVTFLLGKLDSMLSSQLNLIRGVDGEIRILHDRLQWLRAFLKDADLKRRDNERIKVWVGQIRDVAYQAEDAIDEYMCELRHSKGTVFMNCLQGCVTSTRKLKILHDLGNRIEEIKRRLQGISDCRSQLGIEMIQTGEEASSSSSSCLRDGESRASPIVEETNVVGFQRDATILRDVLIQGDLRRVVLSIVGMGGLGKTTLARKVYNINEVGTHFDCRAWVYVSQKYKRRELLQGMVGGFLHLDRKEVAEMSEEDMVDELKRYLRPRRYLLVLDDVWEGEAWDGVCDALPDEMKGSRIILTTRNRHVGQYVDPDGFLHEPQCLDKEESWKLFCSKSFRTGTSVHDCPSELEAIGKKMVGKCAGLPLAIVVLGGLMLRKPKTKIEWTRVLELITYELNQKQGENVRRILALSYDDLPHYLKSCFLYFGLFPEDYEIDAEMLVQLWVAEGFIQCLGEHTMEQVAEDYLEELINRCMIQVVKRNAFGCVVKCRIHDLLHDLSISEGKEENFLDTWVDHPTTGHSVASRRLAVHGMTAGHMQVPSFNQSTSNLRSILCFDVEINLMNHGLRLLRVVDLRGAPVKRLPKQIGEMVHLRYLGFGETDIKKLPSSIGKLPHLQTLRLADDCLMPEVVWKIKTLRHVNGLIRSPTIGCNCKCHLQTLWGIQAGSWVGRDLAELTKLRRLWIRKISVSHVSGLSHSLASLTLLNILVLWMECVPSASASVLLALANHPFLYILNISVAQPLGREVKIGYHGNLRFSPSLVQLTLQGVGFSKQEHLALLEGLPHLVILKLERNSYTGEEMACSAGGFPRLQQLQLLGLDDLVRWRIEDGAMPCLKRLGIWICDGLEMIPVGLQYITTLQRLDLNMPLQFIKRVRREDWYKVQHIPFINTLTY